MSWLSWTLHLLAREHALGRHGITKLARQATKGNSMLTKDIQAMSWITSNLEKIDHVVDRLSFMLDLGISCLTMTLE